MSLFRHRGDDRQRLGEQDKKQIKKTRKIGVCPIVFGGSSLSVLYGYFTRGVRKKHDDLVGVALLEALVR